MILNKRDIYQFASNNTHKTVINNGTSIRGLTEDRISNMIQSPSTSGKDLGLASKTAKNINGSYKRIIKHMSSILDFNHYIYPVYEDVLKAIENKDNNIVEFTKTALAIDRYKLKYHLPIFTEKLFTYGALFVYKLEDKKSIVYQEFDISMCRISELSDGVYRFQIDVSKIPTDSVPYYPKEIQNAVKMYQDGSSKISNKFYDNSYYQVSDKGVAFSLDTDVLNQLGVSVPPFASVLVDVIKYENAKSKMDSKDELDNSIIIHSTVPLDSNGTPTIDIEIVEKYQANLKKGLPQGVYSVTNPFETKMISMKSTGEQAKFSLLNEANKNIHRGSGVSQMLFSDDSNSSQALERSISTDVHWLYSFILPIFANYMNYELKSISKNSNAEWFIEFIETSMFTKEKDISLAKEQLSFGGSRIKYLATTGLSPLEIANLLVFEQDILDIDSLMVVKQNSNTLSKNDEIGRPKTDNPTDKTIDIKDSE